MIAAIVLAIAAVAGARCAEAEERIASAQGELLRAYVDGEISFEKMMLERNRLEVERDVVRAWCRVFGAVPEVRVVRPLELSGLFPKLSDLPERLLPGERYRAGGPWWTYLGKRRIGGIEFLVFVR